MKKWKKFERLIAAINYTKLPDTEVRWDEIINGRQFDVVIKFKKGFYDYITVIECRDKKVKVDEIDGFVTKTKDAKVNKAIMISSKGYQKGCYDVAKRHDITLLKYQESYESNIEYIKGEIFLSWSINEIKIYGNDKRLKTLNEDSAMLNYIAKKSEISTKNISISMKNLIINWQKSLNIKELIKKGGVKVNFYLKENSILKLPDNDKIYDINRLEVILDVINITNSLKPRFDYYVKKYMELNVELINALDGKVEYKEKKAKIKHGFDTKIEKGKFYKMSPFNFYYYCKDIKYNTVTWILIESIQHGELFQATFTQDIQHQDVYEEIHDICIINRLKKRLKKYNVKR